MNPADQVPRRLDANKNKSSSKWFKVPDVLRQNETSWPVERTEAITDEDPEVKHLSTVNMIAEKNEILFDLTQRVFCWKTRRR